MLGQIGVGVGIVDVDERQRIDQRERPQSPQPEPGRINAAWRWVFVRVLDAGDALIFSIRLALGRNLDSVSANAPAGEVEAYSVPAPGTSNRLPEELEASMTSTWENANAGSVRSTRHSRSGAETSASSATGHVGPRGGHHGPGRTGVLGQDLGR